MAYRRNFVRTLGHSISSSGVIGVLLGENPAAESFAGNPACTEGGSAVVIISMVF
jgi:hypothetical protein